MGIWKYPELLPEVSLSLVCLSTICFSSCRDQFWRWDFPQMENTWQPQVRQNTPVEDRYCYEYPFSCSGVDRRIIIWDLTSASQVCELKGHRDTVYQLAFSRDGTILASGGGDNCVKLWDASNFEEAAKSIDSSKW